MIVFLWDACGPGRFRGVTDDEGRARQAAEACLADGRAQSARVELARSVLDIPDLTTDYQRTGQGWMALRRDGRVTWAPFTEQAASLWTAGRRSASSHGSKSGSQAGT